MRGKDKKAGLKNIRLTTTRLMKQMEKKREKKKANGKKIINVNLRVAQGLIGSKQRARGWHKGRDSISGKGEDEEERTKDG